MSATEKKTRAPRNRTIELTRAETEELRRSIIGLKEPVQLADVRNKIINGDALACLTFLPAKSFDLLFADPPYNLSKSFGKSVFRQLSSDKYEEWLDSWLKIAAPLLKPNAAVYICGDWRSSAAVQRVGMRYFKLQNRITWEREKGRGARRNWKNSSEDIWFFTISDEYTFNMDEVRMKRRVIAPYKTNGEPKDWEHEGPDKFRMTHPSNLWTDLTVPFWSMRENTDHPTQKPEKLLAKILLASTNKGDIVLDPFAGSGTTAVASKKLGRCFTGIEIDENYCLVAEKRLKMAEKEMGIQGYSDGVFWERNSNSGK